MNSMMVNEMKAELQGSITLAPHQLEAAYEITNLSGEEIFVLDGLFRLEGTSKLDPSLVYTILEDDTLTLFRGLLPIPKGVQVEVPEVPYARLLPPGGTLKGTIRVSLPLPYNQPYEWNEREETRTAKKLRMRIGYVAAKDVNPRPAARTVSETEVYRLGYRQVVDIQHFLETPVQDGVIKIHVKP